MKKWMLVLAVMVGIALSARAFAAAAEDMTKAADKAKAEAEKKADKETAKADAKADETKKEAEKKADEAKKEGEKKADKLADKKQEYEKRLAELEGKHAGRIARLERMKTFAEQEKATKELDDVNKMIAEENTRYAKHKAHLDKWMQNKAENISTAPKATEDAMKDKKDKKDKSDK